MALLAVIIESPCRPRGALPLSPLSLCASRHPGLPFFDISPGYFILVLIAFAVSAMPVAYTLLTVVSISYVISWPTRQRYLQQSSARISAAVSALCCVVAACVALPLWPGPPPLRLDGGSTETTSQLVMLCRLAIAYGALLGLGRLTIAHFCSAGAHERRRFQRHREQLADSRAYTEILGGWPAKRQRSARSGEVLSMLRRCWRDLLVLAAVPLAQILLLTIAARFFLEWKISQILVLSTILAGANINLWRMARTICQRTSEQARGTDQRKPILILRSFTDDALAVPGDGVDYPAHRLAYPIYRPTDRHRLEEVLGHALKTLAPVVIFGDPREALPSSGAAREYVRKGPTEPVSTEDWQSVVRARMLEASCLIYIIADTEALRWELETGKAIHDRGPLVFLFPPSSTVELEARWKAFREFAEPILGVALSDFPTDNQTKPLAAFFAGDKLIWLDGDDQTGRSFMVAVRAAVVLARERCASIADAESFLQEKVPDLGVSVCP